MRFLLGICSGVVLLLVLRVEGPVIDADGALARGLHRVLPSLAERLASVAPPEAEVAAAPGPDAAPAAADDQDAAVRRPAEDTPPEALAALWPHDAPLPEAFGDAYAWWAREGGEIAPAAGRAADDAVTGPVAPASEPGRREETAEAVADAARVAAAPTRAPDQAAAASAREPAPAAGAPPDREAAAAPRTASVWIPFHSERSATGFAQRLSRALEHPFDVRREGPGRYQVVFPYDDADRRDEVLARVAMLTGTQQ